MNLINLTGLVGDTFTCYSQHNANVTTLALIFHVNILIITHLSLLVTLFVSVKF